MIKRITLLASSILVIAGLGAAGAGSGQQQLAGGLRKHLFKNGTSSNWSGYAVETNLNSPQNNAVNNVSGQWTVPSVSCTSAASYSSVWVGIDGFSDSTVEQTGTEQDCQNGQVQYYAWYEMYPRNMYRISLAVSPGNTVAAAVKFNGNRYYTLTLSNKTTGKSFSTTQRLNGTQRQSAEWVVEAPSSYFGVLPLANFGMANISNASATLNGHTGTIADANWQKDKILMETADGTAKATPSDLASGGSAFSDVWGHN
jgi:hypothetical protein